MKLKIPRTFVAAFLQNFTISPLYPCLSQKSSILLTESLKVSLRRTFAFDYVQTNAFVDMDHDPSVNAACEAMFMRENSKSALLIHYLHVSVYQYYN